MARVLIVEDEMLVAILIEDIVADLGHDVVGPAMRLDAAVKAAATDDIDVAILDLNLAGELSFPVADTLARRGIPYFFASGYGVAGLQEGYKNTPIVQKPFLPGQLAAFLEAALTAAP